MITKKILLGLFFFGLFLLMLNGIFAYTYQIPLCNSSINDSCLNFTSVGPITDGPINGIIFWKDGYLYLTNETIINHTINYYNMTNVTYQNITNVTTNYYYNISNGSSLTIIQNVTANDSLIKEWMNSKMNLSFYNKSDAEITFAFKTELNELKNTLSSYAAKTELDKYGYLLAINASDVINGTIGNKNDINFNLTWEVIIIINCILTVILIIFIIRSMMSG
jgi:hypothetical protein